MPASVLYFSILIVCCCCSCQNLVLQKDSKEEVRKEEWNTINTHSVEQPPLFENCKGTVEEELDACFQNTIIEHVQQVVHQKTIIVHEDLKDTLWLPIHISTEGVITIASYPMPEVLKTQFPEFKEALVSHMATLPKVEAAHSRGIPVATQYRLPIVLRSE